MIDRWISKQTILLQLDKKEQRVTDSHYLVVHDAISDKLISRHRVPCKFLHNAGPIYTVQVLVQDKMVVTHIYNLRPFHYDEERTEPVAVAQQNAQGSVIEQVLVHRGNRKKLSIMEYYIRWTEFGEKNNRLLHRYLRAHQLKSLIPGYLVAGLQVISESDHFFQHHIIT